MTQPSRVRANRSELIDVFCDHQPFIRAATEGDGRYPVRLETGHVVTFALEGDYLAARATPDQARVLEQFSVFEVEGRDRVRDPEVAIVSWMDEGKRLYEEKTGRGGGKPGGNSVFAELAALIGPEKMAQMMGELIGQKTEQAAEEIARTRAAADEARRAAQSTEFNYVRLAENLTDDQVLSLFNEFDPGFDATALPAAARVTRLTKLAPQNAALQYALRDLLPEYGE